MTSISKAIQFDVLAAADHPDERSHHLRDSLILCREQIRQAMKACRNSTLALFQTVDYETFCQQAHPDFSPIGWHLGHIAYTESLWLLEHSAGLPPHRDYRRLFAANSLPKTERIYLPSLHEVRDYLQSVRNAVFASLETAPLDEQERLWRWLLQHEEQHGETIALVLELIRRQRAEDRRQAVREAGDAEGAIQKGTTQLLKASSAAVQCVTQTISDSSVNPSDGDASQTKLNAPAASPASYFPTPVRLSAVRLSAHVEAHVEAHSPLPTPDSPLPTPHSPMLCIPAGSFECGNDSIDALDNERPVHRIHVETYWLDRTPVTCEHYQAFLAADGYQDSHWWSAEGWEWLQTTQVTQPLYWSNLDDRAHHPVCGVSWYEADAYARFVGKRLPTEAEWEKAASWHPIAQQRQTYPWGETAPNAEDCNCNYAVRQTTPVDAYPTGISPFGCYDMLGNVWEWTASWFDRYAGFEAYPYRGYSEAYFDRQHRVLKGGSWATQPSSMRCAFRNWYHPHVREMLAGFRCAANAREQDGFLVLDQRR